MGCNCTGACRSGEGCCGGYPNHIHYIETPKTNLRMVEEFHRTFDVTVNDVPTVLDRETAEFRKELIVEEFKETLEELGYFFGRADCVDCTCSPNGNTEINLTKLAKEMADLLYVVYGTAVTYGIDLDAVFAEVHRSNMSKLTADGKVLRREDGKVLKSDQYRPADLSTVNMNLKKD